MSNFSNMTGEQCLSFFERIFYLCDTKTSLFSCFAVPAFFLSLYSFKGILTVLLRDTKYFVDRYVIDANSKAFKQNRLPSQFDSDVLIPVKQDFFQVCFRLMKFIFSPAAQKRCKNEMRSYKCSSTSIVFLLFFSVFFGVYSIAQILFLNFVLQNIKLIAKSMQYIDDLPSNSFIVNYVSCLGVYCLFVLLNLCNLYLQNNRSIYTAFVNINWSIFLEPLLYMIIASGAINFPNIFSIHPSAGKVLVTSSFALLSNFIKLAVDFFLHCRKGYTTEKVFIA